MGPIRAVVTCAIACLLFARVPLVAADNWTEIASPNFTVLSNAGDGAARNIAWQFEQIRAAIVAGWPWAKADLDRPFLVIAVKDESSMRALAPAYWERRGGIRPGSVSATGQDRHYVLLRTDLRAEGPEGVNPYQMAYWGYTQPVLSDAFDGRLPFWFGRGLSAVLSNTIVTNNQVQFGRPIPWYVEEVRSGRYALADLLTMTRDSPAYQREVQSQRFDAQCWALMHYLVFGEADRALSDSRLNALAKLTLAGTPSVAAVEQVFGSVAKLDAAYRLYVDRGLFRYSTMKVDARFQARDFPARPVPPAEALALRADYLVTTGRFTEARAAIDDAKAAAPDLAGAHAAEGRLFDRESKPEEARAAYEKAVALGSRNFYAFVRLANLTPRQGATPETLATLRTLLTRAVELNAASGLAHQSLGGVLMQMGQSAEAIETLRRAVALDPQQGSARLTLANALLRAGQRDEALKEAQAALALARTDQQRAAAQQTIARIGG